MNKAEHRSALRELNRRNNQLWQSYTRILERELDEGKLLTPSDVLDAEVRAKAAAEKEELREELHSQQQENKRQTAELATAASFKRYHSPLRMAIQSVLVKNPKATGSEVCLALDLDDRAVGSNADDRSFRTQYRAENGSGSLHSTISQVRKDLLGRRART